MAKLKAAQKITIGTKFDQPLFGQGRLDGKPQGFDVEIGKIIAAELGIPADKIEWVETKSAVREEYIEQGKVDLVVATYTINDTRKQRVGFAGPYYVAGQDIMVRKDDNSITGPDSFKDGTKKVCSVTGSTPAKKIEEYVKDKTTQIVLFGGYAQCVDALKTGQVDAVTTDNVILLGYVDQDPTAFKILSKPFTQEPYGIGVKKDDTEFRTSSTTCSRRSTRTAATPRPGRTPSAMSPRRRPARLSTATRSRERCRADPARALQRTGARGHLVVGGARGHPDRPVRHCSPAGLWVTLQICLLSAIGALIIGTVVRRHAHLADAAAAGGRHRLRHASSATCRSPWSASSPPFGLPQLGSNADFLKIPGAGPDLHPARRSTCRTSGSSSSR